MNFEQYISNTVEKYRFRKHVLSVRDFAFCQEQKADEHASEHADEHAGSMLLEMRDSLGSAVSVELFNVSFQNESGSWHHLLGLREFTDVNPITTDRTAGELAGNITAESNAERMERRALARANTSRKGTSSSSDASSGAIDSLQSNSEVRGQVHRSVRVYPDLLPTTSLVHDASVLHAMASWNLLVPRTMCCPFHTYTRELKQTVQRLQRLTCLDEFPFAHSPHHVVQCQACGYLDDCDERIVSSWQCLFCDARQCVQNASSSNIASL